MPYAQTILTISVVCIFVDATIGSILMHWSYEKWLIRDESIELVTKKEMKEEIKRKMAGKKQEK